MCSKVLKVLVIATTKFSMDGITNVILNYYRSIDKSDMQIDFVIPNEIKGELKLELESCGSNIYVINGRTRKPIIYIKTLIRIISKNKYDIVHAHGNSCTLALEMYSAKKGGVYVRIPHCHNTKTKHSIVHKLLSGPFNSLYTHAFACGQKAGEWLYHQEKFEIINNGIDIDKYKYNQEIRKKYRDKYGLNGKKVIGHIGHFSYQKNHEYLIDIFQELYRLDSNYRLLLIGDGELKSDIQRKVESLHLSNVAIFMGKSLEVHRFMQAMDIFVMPSYFEGLPLTLIEAQSASLSCFVSDSVSNEVAITNLVQFISLDKSAKEWAKQINSPMIMNREEIKDNICKQIVDAGYSIEDNAKKLKELYKIYNTQVKN
jgi:glycosyltransferase involved in cell wall biosynthesis